MCIFCSIAKKEIPSHCIYEDDTVLAFLDINPTAQGHTLVIPKEHCASFLDCPASLRDHVFEVAQMLANRLEKELGCDGINVLSNIHEAAGQSVEHFHVHLIPRYQNDTEIIHFHETNGIDFEELKRKLK